MKRIVALPVLASAALGMSSAIAAAAVSFGASLPLTGGLAINGQKHKEGYELCVDLINKNGGLLGEPVSIVISDNQSTNETAQAQFERLINEDKVVGAARHLLEPHHLPDHVDRRAEQDGLPGAVRRGAPDLRARLQIHLQLPAQRRRVCRQVLYRADEGPRARGPDAEEGGRGPCRRLLCQCRGGGAHRQEARDRRAPTR